MTKTAIIGSLDLMAPPYTVVGGDRAPKFPDARLSEAGRAAQLAGAVKHRSHYDPAPYELSVMVDAPTDTLLDALYREWAAGARLTLGDSVGVGTCVILSVDTNTDIHEDADCAIVTFFGDRAPEWEGASVDLGTLSVTGGWGTVDAPAIGGEIAAKCRLYATVAGTASSLHIGVRPDPAADYAPLDDYSGVSDATAIGGAWGAAANLSGTAAALGTAPSVDVAANRGSHLCVARLKNSANAAASVRYSVASAILGAEVVQPSVAATGTSTAAVEVLGTVEVPAAPIPADVGAGLGAPTTDINQTTQDTISIGEPDPFYPVYVFDVDGARLHSVAINYAVGSTGQVYLHRMADATHLGALVKAWGAPTGSGVQTQIIDCDTVSGEQLALKFVGVGGGVVKFRYKATEANAEGNFYKVGMSGATALTASTLTGDLYLVTTVQNPVSLDNSNTLRATCSESSKTGSVDAMLRVPTDFAALSVTTALTANTGVMYDPDTRSLYPCDSSPALTGTALRPSLLSGIHLAPGVTNRFVVAAGAKTDVTLQGMATECYIRRR